MKEYKKKHGHVRIPQKLDEPKGLGNWVLDQRRRYRERNLPANERSSKKGPLKEVEITKLESIGFEWSIRNRGFGGEEEEAGGNSKTLVSTVNNSNEETSVMVDFATVRDGGNNKDELGATTKVATPTQEHTDREEGDDQPIAMTTNEMDISATSAKNLQEAADELLAI